MAANFGINSGILTVHEEFVPGLEKDVLGIKLEKILSLNERILTVRRCCSRNVTSEIKFLLAEWTDVKKHLDFIIIAGRSVIFNDDKTSELTQSAIETEVPYLDALLCKEKGIKRCKLFIRGKTLILMLPSYILNEAHLESLTSAALLLVNDIHIGTVNLSSLTVKNALSDNCSCRSKINLTKVAERPRKSPFAMISVSSAVERILQESASLEKEYKSFRDCFSFILAEDVIAIEPYPPFPASIKDGYAVIAEDVSTIRRVIGATTPGCKPEFDMMPGSCVRVSTGSVIPDGADAVIQVEDTAVAEMDSEGNEIKIEILKPAKPFQDIRAIGSDVDEGQILIPVNSKVSFAEIGVMAVCGIQKVLVYQKPWVALLSTGDEVLEPGMPITPGCIRDSNKSSLMFMLKENQIPVVDIGIARDTPDDVKAHLMLAFETSDIIISTGGVSMGERDVLKQVLQVDFEAVVHFGRVHMKPGKPATFSTVNYNGQKKLIFSLPGNPVSACVCFYLFVMPCIRKLMGFKEPEHHTVKVKLGHDLKLDERPEFYRVSLRCGDDGIFIAQGTGAQQSSRLLSMQKADALLVLPPQSKLQFSIKAGSLVEAILLKPI